MPYRPEPAEIPLSKPGERRCGAQQPPSTNRAQSASRTQPATHEAILLLGRTTLRGCEKLSPTATASRHPPQARQGSTIKGCAKTIAGSGREPAIVLMKTPGQGGCECEAFYNSKLRDTVETTITVCFSYKAPQLASAPLIKMKKNMPRLHHLHLLTKSYR
jgi:hypothetical protein